MSPNVSSVKIAAMSETGAPAPALPLFLGDVVSAESTTNAGGFVVPAGTVTFLIADVHCSNISAEGADGGLRAMRDRCSQILDDAAGAHRGVRPVDQHARNAVLLAFARASDAVAAALNVQLAVHAEPWSDGAVVSVRIAVHSGEAQLRYGYGYFGPVVARAGRIGEVSHDGQVLVSDATASLVADVWPAQSSLVDLGVVRLRDLGRPEHIWQLTHPVLRGAYPPLQGLERYPQNLPSQLSPLVGRHTEVVDVSGIVMSERLVTLTGSGGVGKSRLALAVAAHLIDRFAGGVWFVELVGTGGAGSAARATLRALDVMEAPAIVPGRQVAVELGERGPSLLVVDNCEHTLDDCVPFIAELLTAEPTVTVLATSREPLGLTGEALWPVPPLPTAPIDEPIPIDALSQFDAVNLFVDRARRARPTFTVTDTNAGSVAQICARLDGIPLAIELAAARCRHLTTEHIVEQLDDRFRLLTGGSRVAIPRHQTLAASVQWSYDLLDRTEQLVLRRLSVFQGPFALEAAETVVAAPGNVDRVTVFDVVSRLVDKSLIMTDERHTSARFRMLETIRVFALDHARRAGEFTDLHQTHARWWKHRLEQLGGPTDDAVDEFDAYHDDIVAALSWTAEHDHQLGLRVLTPLAPILEGARHAGDAIRVCDRLLDPDREAEHPQAWLQAALPAVITVRSHLGRDRFQDLLRRCEQVAAALDDDYSLAIVRARQTLHMDNYRRMVEMARERDDHYCAALGLVYLAIDALTQAPEQAAQTLNDALRIADEYPSTYIRSFTMLARGEHELVFGQLSAAVEYGRSLRNDRTANLRLGSLLLLGLGGLLSRDRRAIVDAIELARRDATLGIPIAENTVELFSGILAMMDGEQTAQTTALPPIDRLMTLVAGRDAINRSELAQARAIAESLTGRGPGLEASRYVTLGLLDQDEDDWQHALHAATEHGYRLIAVDAIEGLGVTAATADSPTEALRLFAAAERIRDETGYRWRFPFEQHRYECALADSRNAVGEGAEAAWREGRSLGLAAVTEYASRARGERRRPRHGWDSLTPTELRVVELAAAGHSNPQIAERLLMSRATVKTHLEHVYAKTGIRNRTELAAEATRRT